LLAAHSIPANSSGDFKPVHLGDGVSPEPAVSDSQSSKARDESVLVERRATFSARLRAARESKRVSLEQIAASSKINVSLLKALESGDVSRWPKGLFRRSYLRDYLRAVGLPVEPTVADFVRLFPDEEDLPIETTAACEEDESPALSMTLEGSEDGWRIRVRRHAAAATIDAGIVLIASGALALWVQADFSVAVASLALVYYSVATTALGHSLGAHWAVDRNRRRWKTASSVAAHRDSLAERVRRLRDLSIPRSSGVPREAAQVAWRREGTRVPWRREAARVPWSAILLRIRFLR
jgi:transcriptional regulator with XRE-family HTH domain